jgi:hypothetical protein
MTRTINIPEDNGGYWIILVDGSEVGGPFATDTNEWMDEQGSNDDYTLLFVSEDGAVSMEEP